MQASHPLAALCGNDTMKAAECANLQAQVAHLTHGNQVGLVQRTIINSSKNHSHRGVATLKEQAAFQRLPTAVQARRKRKSIFLIVARS